MLEITEYQANVDVICLTGDFLDQSIHAELALQEQISWLKKWSKTINRPLFLCSGNHDFIDEDLNTLSLEELFLESELALKKLYNPLEWLQELASDRCFVDNQIKKIDGVTFGCMKYEEESFEKFSACDVILTHVPPAKTQVSTDGKGDFGCKNLRRSIITGAFKPAMILSGHIHGPLSNKARLKFVKLYNPGYLKCVKDAEIILIEKLT